MKQALTRRTLRGLRMVPNGFARRVVLTSALFGIACASATVSGQVVGEDIEFLAFDGADDDRFGHSVAIENNILVIGALRDSVSGIRSGSAYLFNTSTGELLRKLLPNDGSPDAEFGVSTAIARGIVAVGARGDDQSGFGSGSVYLFDAATGVQLMKLVPTAGSSSAHFGTTIAMENDIIVIGAPSDAPNGSFSGSGYLFRVTTGELIAKLIPDDSSQGAQFGASVAIHDALVAVGSSTDSVNGLNSGSAYLFEASTGAQIAKMAPDDGMEFDFFGQSIAINNGVLAVGATNDIQSGSVYIFDVNTHEQTMKLVPNTGSVDLFGRSIGIGNGVLAVGAPFRDNNGLSTGAVDLFDLTDGTHIAELLASDGASGDFLGASIAIDNGVVVVGATFDRENGTRPGSAYSFTIRCPADFTNDFSLDIFDFLAFLDALNAKDPAADFTSDGFFNIFDILGFLDAFNTGCLN